MKELKCPNCGGMINPASMVCEYCGSRFENKKENLILLEEHRPGVDVIAAKVSVSRLDMQYLSPEEVSSYAVNSLIKQLSNCIAPYMKISRTTNMKQLSDDFVGEIRVLKQGYRF